MSIVVFPLQSAAVTLEMLQLHVANFMFLCSLCGLLYKAVSISEYKVLNARMTVENNEMEWVKKEVFVANEALS